MEAIEALAAQLTDARFRGTVRIEKGAAVLIDAAYGEDAAGAPLTTGTAFQIASISKSFTAACVLLLAEQGRLGLDDQLVSFLDSAPAEWDEITVRQLLTHTSGLAHWHEVPDHDHFRRVSRAELIGKFAAAPLHFTPGTNWSYSSPGFVLLAHVVETVAGVAYPAFLRKNVLEPLGLRRTAAEEPAPDAPAAQGSRGGGPAPSFDLAVNVGTGDVWSTTGDLILWPENFATFDPLRPAVREAAQSAQAPTTREIEGMTNVGYGYGWFTATFAGTRLVFHSGDNAGFVSLLVWAPERDLRLVMLAADEVRLADFALPALAGLLGA